VQWSVAVAVVVIVALVVVLVLRPETMVTKGASTTSTLACASARLTSDYEIDQCLESRIRVVTVQMDSLLRVESVYFLYASVAQDWRVARRTQSTFMAYARKECLAQANPYQPGTIVPILFGECVLGFYNQRVHYLRDTIASMKKGGESRVAS
jgi:uncharacterized protein YecT (DUF1311 family)